MTPNELNMCVEIYAEKTKQESDAKLQLEWVNAYWQRIEILKPFEEMIQQPKEEKKMSDNEMLANAHRLNALFGGDVQ
jgi:hypothetical protein